MLNQNKNKLHQLTLRISTRAGQVELHVCVLWQLLHLIQLPPSVGAHRSPRQTADGQKTARDLSRSWCGSSAFHMTSTYVCTLFGESATHAVVFIVVFLHPWEDFQPLSRKWPTTSRLSCRRRNSRCTLRLIWFSWRSRCLLWGLDVTVTDNDNVIKLSRTVAMGWS